MFEWFFVWLCEKGKETFKRLLAIERTMIGKSGRR